MLHRGILEGRRASGNMMKYLLMGTSSNFGNMFSMAAASVFLPFLPMLPTQILLNNFLYDLAQVTIPGDNVDETYLRRPQRWDMRVIRDFMVFIGPISSIFDFLTFYVLLHYFHAQRVAVPHGVVRRVARDPDARAVRHPHDGQPVSEPPEPCADDDDARDRRGRRRCCRRRRWPSGSDSRGYPPAYFAFLIPATVTYLVMVDVAKRQLVRRVGLSPRTRAAPVTPMAR